MFGLPENSNIGKQLPKTVIYAKFAMNTAERERFDADISRIASSKSTIIHSQCVSTGCCVHVARIKISNDNQHVTKPMQRYDILPEQPKEKA